MYLYNTLSRKVEEFVPLKPPHVGMYTCGPTVYDFSHIGHMRRYVGDDILVRILDYNGFEVKNVVNALENKNLKDKILIEVSGGINPDNILDYANIGVDIISTGYITHSVRSLDMSLEINQLFLGLC